MRTYLIFPITSRGCHLCISEHKKFLHCQGYEEFSEEFMEAPLSEAFFTWRKKMLSRPDDFMLYAKLGVDFFSNSELQKSRYEN